MALIINMSNENSVWFYAHNSHNYLQPKSHLCFRFIYPNACLTSPFRCLMGVSNFTCPKWASCFSSQFLPSLVNSSTLPIVERRKLGIVLISVTPLILFFFSDSSVDYTISTPKLYCTFAPFFQSPLPPPYFKPTKSLTKMLQCAPTWNTYFYFCLLVIH